MTISGMSRLATLRTTSGKPRESATNPLSVKAIVGFNILKTAIRHWHGSGQRGRANWQFERTPGRVQIAVATGLRHVSGDVVSQEGGRAARQRDQVRQIDSGLNAGRLAHVDQVLGAHVP